jgi:outer membrane lipoprotein-sorting protein
LKYILDKNFLIKEISNLEERIINDKFINFKILKEDNEINIFFDKKNFNFIGWQTLDIYQNLNITFISSIKKNQVLKKNFFKLPKSN